MADDNQPRQPVTTKTTQRGENDRLEYAVSSMQGYRRNMEDAVSNLPASSVPYTSGKIFPQNTWFIC